MQHLISAAMYTLTVVLLLVMIAMYVLCEYNGSEFIKDFWWVLLLAIVSVVLGAYIGEPERFPYALRSKYKMRK